MATIKERDEIEFRRILHQARYRQFNFSVKTSKETWNDENRLKMTVTNVETIDNQTRKKHIERLKAEIEPWKFEDWIFFIMHIPTYTYKLYVTITTSFYILTYFMF